jgi:hypothetical protein
VKPVFFRHELRLAADSLLLLSNAEVSDLIWMSSAPALSNPSTLAIPAVTVELLLSMAFSSSREPRDIHRIASKATADARMRAGSGKCFFGGTS